MALHTVYKHIGETPLQALERFRRESGISDDIKMTYAGRLDPAAEGLLLLLSDKDVYRKEDFLGLPKQYEFEVLFGVATDSLDVLGIPEHQVVANDSASHKILLTLDSFIGSFEWEYPNFSSKPVEGEPLFSHAKKGNDVSLPTRTMTIDTLEILGSKIIHLEDVEEKILETVSRVSGDFRQDEITTAWKQMCTLHGSKSVCVVKFRADVRSGTYIRVLAQKMGEAIGLPALALSIKRTKIGGMSI